ncbi:5570_t:CDS:2 [Entrophospora sp. SA101]|nr:5570_t:CDS:2 [Entrophospora sp. SA101]CAJ0835360.1 9578_t:CDS:2 [Entrophospora sp. SA101]
MLTFPIKRRFSPEDPFFSLGNIEARSEWLKKHSTLQIEKTQIIKEELHEEFSPKPITCQFPPWCQTHPIRFPSVSAYEVHYNTSHRHICNECDKVFPSERWLKLHLTENHDVIIQIKKERGEKIYECFVQGCGKFFSEPKKRRLHLIDKHHYPKKFNFTIVQTGIVPFSIRNKLYYIKKKKSKKKEKDEKNKAKKLNVSNDNNSNSNSSKNNIESSDSMEVDNLTESMRKLKVKNISFGRR